MSVETAESAPDFTALSSNGKPFRLSDFRGKWIVLYFYPKDDTPGCTKEACGFRDNFRRLEALNAVVFGCSPDELKVHDRFIAKYDLPFTLLSDPGHEIALGYDVWKEKNMYGRKIMGIERSTFLIDPKGNVHRVWRKVKVDGHVDDVLDEIRAASA